MMPAGGSACAGLHLGCAVFYLAATAIRVILGLVFCDALLLLLQVRFKHRDTGVYLTSHEVRFGNPIAGQQEVCGHSYAGKNAEWQATEGVYLPVNMGRKSGDKAGSADEL